MQFDQINFTYGHPWQNAATPHLGSSVVFFPENNGSKTQSVLPDFLDFLFGKLKIVLEGPIEFWRQF